MERSKFYIKSTARLDSFTKASLSRVKERLTHYPGLRLISEGSELEYSLELKEQKNGKEYFLLASKQGIALTLYSKTSPEYFEAEFLLRLLNLAQVLSDLYAFELSSIFPNLLHLLYNVPRGEYTNNKESIEVKGRDVELILSKRVISLLGKNKKLAEEASNYKELVLSLLGKVAFLEHFNGDSKALAKEYNISIEMAEKALAKKEELESASRVVKW
ncbi:MAG: hypothetical protein ACP5P2_00340 [Candidatus Micrarchaeia archaeon]|jgi:hypothetical protein